MSLTDEEHPGWVAIVVSDEGMGIPGHEQSRVFNRFVRGTEATSRRIRGTGIGLAMVREIARAHGGEVTVASDVGVGSTFRLVLPVIAQHAQASKAAPQAASLEPQDPRTVT